MMDTRKGDIPETDQELDKILAAKQKPVKRTSKAQKSKALVVDIAPEDVIENHEPGQPLPEDQAEQAASGSGWQGEEISDLAIPDTSERKLSKHIHSIIDSVDAIQDYVGKELNSTEEVEQAIEEIIAKETALELEHEQAKAAYKQSRGATISPEVAANIAHAKGWDVDGKPVRKKKATKEQSTVVAGTTSPKFKLTDEQKRRYAELEAADQPEITEALVKQILQLLGEGKSTIETREITKVHYTTIRNIARGKAYQQWSGLGTVEQKEEK